MTNNKQTIIINAPGETKNKTNESETAKTVKDTAGSKKLQGTLRSQEVLLMAEAKKFGISLSDTALSLFKLCFYTLNVVCLMAFMIVMSFIKKGNKGPKKEPKESKPFEIKI